MYIIAKFFKFLFIERMIIMPASTIEGALDELFEDIKKASTNPSDSVNNEIRNHFKNYVEILEREYVPNDNQMADMNKYLRACWTVARVIITENANERKQKCGEGIADINEVKQHLFGKQAKIVRFFQKIQRAEGADVGANLNNIHLSLSWGGEAFPYIDRRMVDSLGRNYTIRV